MPVITECKLSKPNGVNVSVPIRSRRCAELWKQWPKRAVSPRQFTQVPGPHNFLPFVASPN